MEQRPSSELHCSLHTERPAVSHCQQCSRPLCYECRKITEDGTFCSDNCAAQYHALYGHDGVHKKAHVTAVRAVIIPGIAKLVILAALVGVLIFIVRYMESRYHSFSYLLNKLGF